MNVERGDMTDGGGRVFVDDAVDEAFAARGYAVHPFIGPAAIEALNQLHEETSATVPADFFSTVLSQHTDQRHRVSEGIRAIVTADLRRILPHHRMVFGVFVSKRANTTQGRLPLHQDWWIVDNRIHRAVHVWCPLVDVGPESGCLKVVPGVHRFLKDPYPIHPKYRTAYHPHLARLDAEFSSAVSMPAGAGLSYDQRMLHGSGENRSSRPRLAFNCIMIPDAVRASLYQWDERTPHQIDVLDVDDGYLCEFTFGAPVKPPYPAGVRFRETIGAAISPFGEEELARLGRLQQAFADRA